MSFRIVLSSAAVAVLGGCVISGGGAPPPEPAPQPEPPPAQTVVVQQVPQPQPQPQPTATMVAQEPTAQMVATSTPAVGAIASNFGTVELRRGFMPDPHVVTGVSGGRIDAAQLRSDCTGWIASTPDHVLWTETGFGSLRIAARSNSDTTLVVMDSNNRIWCNDDSDGLHPMVETQLAPGAYRIWVGSYAEGDNDRYSLGFSELQSMRPSSLPHPRGEVEIDSNFGTVELSAGFVPDPHVVSGVSGGQVDASQVGSTCRGWISSTPDHVLQARTGFAPIRIMARSSADTTLVVMDQAGRVWCNDDAEGRDPMIQTQLAQGTYRIWVGSYSHGQNARYSLGFSELGSVSPSSLSAP